MNRQQNSGVYDCGPINNKLERFLVSKVICYLLPEANVYLDFEGTNINDGLQNSGTIKIQPPRLLDLLWILTNPSKKFPEAFVDGRWCCKPEELTKLILLFKNQKVEKTRHNGLLLGLDAYLIHVYKQYLSSSERRKVRNHYNQDPRFYEKVIGKNLVYSCAFFQEGNESLEVAQTRKIETTLSRLKLPANTKSKPEVLDIGCGWGGFIFHCNNLINANFTGISISISQVDFANQKLNAIPNNGKNCSFHCVDYKNWRIGESNLYDGIVSIGMLEHVGKTEYINFFREVSRLLKPGCRAVIHSITRRDTGVTNPWIDKYIFPGGYIPRVSEVIRNIEDSGMVLLACHRHEGVNYQKTLRCWLDNLLSNQIHCMDIIESNIRESSSWNNEKIAYESKRVFRIWIFYLASIQMIFDHEFGSCDVTQFVISNLN